MRSYDYRASDGFYAYAEAQHDGATVLTLSTDDGQTRITLRLTEEQRTHLVDLLQQVAPQTEASHV